MQLAKFILLNYGVWLYKYGKVTLSQFEFDVKL